MRTYRPHKTTARALLRPYLHLSARALIEGDSGGLIRPLKADSQARLSTEDEADQLKQWRKSGPSGKLHNLVQFIIRSPQRRETFTEIAGGKLWSREIS